VEDELGHRGWRESRSDRWCGQRGVGVTGSERGGAVGGGNVWVAAAWVGIAGAMGENERIRTGAAGVMGENERIRAGVMDDVGACGVGFLIYAGCI
jgi:hypothetical protein